MSKSQKESNIARTGRKSISYESESAETWNKTTILMSLLCISLLLGLGLRSFNTLIIDGDVEVTLVLLMLSKRQYVAYIIRLTDDSVMQQVSNVHVILCMHYAGHKSGKWISVID